jgi:preprotein translocase subunit SecY
MWYQKIIQIFKIKELRNKILFILGVFVIFRIMANLPIPGIDASKLKELFSSFQFFGLLNLFTGGALERLSIAMLGLGPYITAVIVLQLLTMIFPALKTMYQEEGEIGRQKFNQYGRILTVPLAALQSFGFLTLLQKQAIINPLSPFLLFTSILTITAACLLLMWLGELISEKGIGNGISLLIFAGIVAEVPNNIRQLIISWDPAKISSYLFFFLVALLIIVLVVMVTEARRNIPISYAKRVRGNRLYGGSSTYLPLNVNPAGVIPIIFAISIILLPTMIANFLVTVGGLIGKISHQVSNFFNNTWVHTSLFFILVVLFTYFYTAIIFEPKTIASNLQKMGGYIPGTRPGEATARFLSFILNRVLPIGALFLGLIAVLPSVIGALTGVLVFQFLVGGTSLLIVVSVVLETIRQLDSELKMREYETF